MKKIFGLIFLFSFATNQAGAQVTQTQQLEVAKTYVSLIHKGQAEESWKLFDKTNVTKQQFDNAFQQMQNILSSHDSFPLVAAIIRQMGNKLFHVYRFKVLSTNVHIISDVFVEVIFHEKSEFVGGMQYFKLPKDSTSISSNNKETPVEKAFVAEIDGKSYKIRGIHIVHFENNVGFLVIQVERKMTDQDLQNQLWTKPEAIIFGKYLLENNYLEKAKLKARELGLNLTGSLGVSFIKPDMVEGINVPLEIAEIK